jgi:hypothetical protein
MTPIRKRKSLNNVVRAACGTAFAAGAMCSSAQETAEPHGVFRIDVTGYPAHRRGSDASGSNHHA